MRGVNLKLNRAQAVHRALQMVAARPKNKFGQLVPIGYRLEGGFNGGFDPHAAHCASWSYGDRTPTADCIGFVLWASGIDRMQPGYAGSRGEWLNCASLLDDADGAKKFCRPVVRNVGSNQAPEDVLPGDWLLTRDHIGIIVRPDNIEADGYDHLVIDCSPRHGRSTAINTGYAWSDACRAIRPLIYSEP